MSTPELKQVQVKDKIYTFHDMVARLGLKEKVDQSIYGLFADNTNKTLGEHTANLGTLNQTTNTHTTQIAEEREQRETKDISLQQQIDGLTARGDVVDIVKDYATLLTYDTSFLTEKDKIKVLKDETKNNVASYYEWTPKSTPVWTFIGDEGERYTKAEVDDFLEKKVDKVGYVATDNNFTNAYKTKLEGLNNYDDTKIKKDLIDESAIRQTADRSLQEQIDNIEVGDGGINNVIIKKNSLVSKLNWIANLDPASKAFYPYENTIVDGDVLEDRYLYLDFKQEDRFTGNLTTGIMQNGKFSLLAKTIPNKDIYIDKMIVIRGMVK